MEYDGSEPLNNLDHEEFCHHFIRTRNIATSGKEIGVNKRQNAHTISKRPEVQARINHLKKEILDELGLDDYYVLKNLKSIAERCMQAEAVTDREGAPIVEVNDGEMSAIYKFDAQAAIKANELIGKHVGMFNDKVKHEHTGADGKPISMNLEVTFTDEPNQSTD